MIDHTNIINYNLTIEELEEKFLTFAEEFGINIVGSNYENTSIII